MPARQFLTDRGAYPASAATWSWPTASQRWMSETAASAVCAGDGATGLTGAGIRVRMSLKTSAGAAGRRPHKNQVFVGNIEGGLANRGGEAGQGLDGRALGGGGGAPTHPRHS